MGDLSRNFNRSEFACKCGCGFNAVDENLVAALQGLRDSVGRPVGILSGLRCEKHNKNIGGAQGSMHVLGKAADIAVPGMSPRELYRACEAIPVFLRGGVGIGFGRFHVDVRGVRARWGYDAAGRVVAFREP